ncbi:MAG: HAMP domain-containing sensor histidine kinase [Ruminococcus sp.]
MKRLAEIKGGLTLHFKLLCYFLVFGAIILVVLWVFQSFLLKPYYTAKKSNIVEKSAARIVRAIEQNKNIWTTVDNVASYNSLTVYLYDTESVMGFTTPIYEINYDNPAAQLTIEPHEVYSYYRYAKNGDGTYMCVDSNSLDDIARQKLERLRKAFTGATSDSTPEVHYRSGATNNVENMVYAAVASRSEGDEMFVLVTSSITPLSNTLAIMQGQLLWVSVVFVILALLFSLYASRRIARPISKTNSAAKELAKKNYSVEFDAKGYLEVKELNDTLNYAKTELAATEKLQRELIANISHDLRTPLTMITGYGEVMRDLPGENTPENIQIIIDEATRLSTLVNDLLDLSKLQSGALQAEKKEFCLTDSVRDIFTRYAKLVEQDGYNIIFEAYENVYINADELRISQVIYNLVNNAVNHVGEDKTVIVTQKPQKGGKVRIEVTDHGEGIPADKLEYIWERYYKVDKEHKRGVIGSGLGLSIVKSILDAHNAHYGVRSALGKGSTFWFEIAATRIEKTNL